ncbi:hypothetical protein Hamer_G006600 [Homarus americanus]|uniref:Uncharacterized protein n=1 Tax=Homarus americanus TaxID=6706 RepID=A0A8J5JIE2_HOMAM|nr:hypothetical protein Hamer_G006600 [Homarus americanus]
MRKQHNNHTFPETSPYSTLSTTAATKSGSYSQPRSTYRYWEGAGLYAGGLTSYLHLLLWMARLRCGQTFAENTDQRCLDEVVVMTMDSALSGFDHWQKSQKPYESHESSPAGIVAESHCSLTSPFTSLLTSPFTSQPS